MTGNNIVKVSWVQMKNLNLDAAYMKYCNLNWFQSNIVLLNVLVVIVVVSKLLFGCLIPGVDCKFGFH